MRRGYVVSPPCHSVEVPFHASLLRLHPMVLQWRDGSCRKSYGDATDLPKISRHYFDFQCVPVVLKVLKPPGQPSDDRRFNTVYPNSTLFFPASLRLWSRLAPVSKPGRTGAVYRDCVNKAQALTH